MALVADVLVITGVALDLVGAGVLAHAHNVESIVELRDEVADEGAALGERDALSTHAMLLAEKRIGFLLLTGGLVAYLGGLVLKSQQVALTGAIAAGVVIVGVATSLVVTRVAGARIREQARRAEEAQDPEALPKQ